MNHLLSTVSCVEIASKWSPINSFTCITFNCSGRSLHWKISQVHLDPLHFNTFSISCSSVNEDSSWTSFSVFISFHFSIPSPLASNCKYIFRKIFETPPIVIFLKEYRGGYLTAVDILPSTTLELNSLLAALFFRSIESATTNMQWDGRETLWHRRGLNDIWRADPHCNFLFYGHWTTIIVYLRETFRSLIHSPTHSSDSVFSLHTQLCQSYSVIMLNVSMHCYYNILINNFPWISESVDSEWSKCSCTYLDIILLIIRMSFIQQLHISNCKPNCICAHFGRISIPLAY